MTLNHATENTPQSHRPVALRTWWLAALGLTLLWDLAGADLSLMHLFGSAHGFALREHWLLSQVLHDALRQLTLAFYLLLWVWALWPTRGSGVHRRWLQLPRSERLGVLLLVSLSLLAVNLLKKHSLTSCPWELQAFGGQALYVSHWDLWRPDGGRGHCFPGGHASSLFGLLAVCLPWLQPPAQTVRRRKVGLRWLFALLGVGLLAGAVQTVRGAHYPGHTLWTLVICAGVSLAGWWLMFHPRRAARDPCRSPTQAHVQRQVHPHASDDGAEHTALPEEPGRAHDGGEQPRVLPSVNQLPL